jgi:hypothetical protein
VRKTSIQPDPDQAVASLDLDYATGVTFPGSHRPNERRNKSPVLLPSSSDANEEAPK